jgi:hypothetical protein
VYEFRLKFGLVTVKSDHVLVVVVLHHQKNLIEILELSNIIGIDIGN